MTETTKKEKSHLTMILDSKLKKEFKLISVMRNLPYPALLQDMVNVYKNTLKEA